MADIHDERVAGGALPDWEVAELPEPPKYQFGKAFRSILGPGIIALGASIGSGEWLLGPRNYGAIRRESPMDRDNRYFAAVDPEHRGNPLYALHRRTDVERLYAL